MYPMVAISCMAALLLLIGALIGADLQARLHEAQRRRTATRIRHLNEMYRAHNRPTG